MFTDLKSIWAATQGRSILSLFDADADRARRFSVAFDDMLFDYSKTNTDTAAMQGLIKLAQDRGVDAKRDAMFGGDEINDTEGRAVLHTALRNLDNQLQTGVREVKKEEPIG